MPGSVVDTKPNKSPKQAPPPRPLHEAPLPGTSDRPACVQTSGLMQERKCGKSSSKLSTTNPNLVHKHAANRRPNFQPSIQKFMHEHAANQTLNKQPQTLCRSVQQIVIQTLNRQPKTACTSGRKIVVQTRNPQLPIQKLVHEHAACRHPTVDPQAKTSCKSVQHVVV
eukprot:365041-Chlamydomonas_euryale.AAC.13